MVILWQPAGGQEIKVSVGRKMCQDGFISAEMEDSSSCHQCSVYGVRFFFGVGKPPEQ